MTEGKDNRENILSAAEGLFAVKGYAATSVREILRVANVSNPMLYYYFGSKQELLLTLLNERVGAFLAEANHELGKAEDLATLVTRWAELTFSNVFERTTTLRLIFSVWYGPQAGLPESELREFKRRLSAFLPQHMSRVAPTVSPRRLAFAAMMTFGMVHSLMTQILAGFVTEVPEALPAAIAARVVAMIDDDLPVPNLEFMSELVKAPAEVVAEASAAMGGGAAIE